MDSNNLNDISKIYLEQVSTQLDEKKKEKTKRWWDDDGDNIGYEEGEVSGNFKKKKIKEALIGRQSEIDANKNGEIDAHDFKILRSTKKKKQVKEGFSNWREDLIEVADKIPSKDEDQKIVEKEVNNKIDINPKLNLGERVEELGGTLLEMSEIENFEGVFDYLSESEIFFLSDELIEQVVEEVFYECLEEGYDLRDVENSLLESLEISSAILTEAKVTLGHDTKIKSDRLEKVKSAVKAVGKGIAHGAGYTAGLAVRGAKAVKRELGKGYQRGRHGSSGGSGSSATTSSGETQTTSSGGESEDKKPGLLSRIGSALKRGLKRVIAGGARAVSRGARNVARRMSDGSASTDSTTSTSPKVTQGHQSKVTHGRGEEPKQEPKPKQEQKPPKVISKTVKASTSQESKPKPKPPARRFGSTSSYTPSGEAAYQAAKQELENKNKKSRKKPKAKASDKDNTNGKLDDLLASVRQEELQIEGLFGGSIKQYPSGPITKPKPSPIKSAPSKIQSGPKITQMNSYEVDGNQLSEKAESEQQQKLFGLALSVKRGKTPRSEVSAEVLKIVDTMSEKKIRDFAKTSHEGIPKKVQTKEEAIKEELIYRMNEKIKEQKANISV